MNKKVLVKIRGLQSIMQDGEMQSDSVEVVSCGKYGVISGKECIVYEEASEDTNIVLKNSIKISDNMVEISRNGTDMGNITFLKDSRTVSVYTTPLGPLSLGIYTSDFEIVRSEQKILIKLAYAIDLNDDYVSDNRVEIEIIFK